MSIHQALLVLSILLGSCASINQNSNAPDPVELELFGHGFEVTTLEPGARAFSNRKYIWMDVPDWLVGTPYTQTSGGVEASMNLKANASTTLHVVVSADRMLDMEDLGWTLEPLNRANTFAFSSADIQMMVLMSRTIAQGESLSIPQLGWAGSLLLFPSATSRGASLPSKLDTQQVFFIGTHCK